MKHRVCYWPDCITILSRSNPGPYCWTHTPEKPSMPFIKVQRRVMSDDFLAGMPGSYEVTAEERAEYKRGGGAY